MDLSEENVARLLARDAALLAERARDVGVTAYMQKAVLRARPNEQFLRATIRNMQTGNRRDEESAMWRQRLAQLSDHRPQRTAEVVAANRDRHVANQRHVQNDEATLDMLSTMPVRSIREVVCRGRGGVGSRVDEAGPYLPTDGSHATGEQEDAMAQSPVTLGPARPNWMQQSSPAASEPSSSSRPRRHSAQYCIKEGAGLKDAGISKKHKSHKHKKHSKLKHKHKHRDKRPKPVDSQ